jgi:hypothetical protein
VFSIPLALSITFFSKAVTGEAVVDGESRAFGLMGKCIPMNPMREKWIVEVNIFKKEVLAYTVILPTFRKLQPDGVELGVPRCHFSEDKVLLDSLTTINDRAKNNPIGSKEMIFMSKTNIFIV